MTGTLNAVIGMAKCIFAIVKILVVVPFTVIKAEVLHVKQYGKYDEMDAKKERLLEELCRLPHTSAEEHANHMHALLRLQSRRLSK